MFESVIVNIVTNAITAVFGTVLYHRSELFKSCVLSIRTAFARHQARPLVKNLKDAIEKAPAGTIMKVESEDRGKHLGMRLYTIPKRFFPSVFPVTSKQ